MHNRNFGSTELDVALQKCNSSILHVKVRSVVYRYNRLPCVDRTQKQQQTFLEFTRCWSTCSVMKHVCACVQVNHSAFCHFKPFAFLHLICDGALACSSIPLQWKQYHRSQEVGRLVVTRHVHGSDLRKHIFCLVNFCITDSGWGRPVSHCPFTSLVWYLGTAQQTGTQLCGCLTMLWREAAWSKYVHHSLRCFNSRVT